MLGICCPSCKSGAIRKRLRSIEGHEPWKCYHCLEEFTKPNERDLVSHWAGRKDTKRKTEGLEIMNKPELLHAIKSKGTPMNQALACFAYLMGGRISEIVGQKSKKEESGYRIKPVRKHQLEERTIAGKKYLVLFHVGTLKRRKVIYRNIPISMKTEADFLEIIFDYASDKAEDEPLFKMSRQRAWAIIKGQYGWFPHYFRHLRSSHLVEYEGFSEGDLMRYHGWSSPNMGKNYVHLDWKHLAKKME